MGILVRATAKGYYNSTLRNPPGETRDGKPIPGSVFEISTIKHFSREWMELLDEDGNSLSEEEASAVIAALKQKEAANRAQKSGKPVAPVKPAAPGKPGSATKPAAKASAENKAREEELSKIRACIETLDPEIEVNWTKEGTPAAVAVSEEVGFEVSADDIKKALPGYTRDAARVAAANASSGGSDDL